MLVIPASSRYLPLSFEEQGSQRQAALSYRLYAENRTEFAGLKTIIKMRIKG